MIRLLVALALLAGLVALVVVGTTILDEFDTGLREQAIQQAERACNAHLPGGNWSVLNRSVNLNRLDSAQQLACWRNGSIQHINVTIDIEVTNT